MVELNAKAKAMHETPQTLGNELSDQAKELFALHWKADAEGDQAFVVCFQKTLAVNFIVFEGCDVLRHFDARKPLSNVGNGPRSYIFVYYIRYAE